MSGYTVRMGYPRSQNFTSAGCAGVGETSAAATIGMILEAKKDFRLNCIEDVVPEKDGTETPDVAAETQPDAPVQEGAGEPETPQTNLFGPAYDQEVLVPNKKKKKEKAQKEAKEPGKFVTWFRQQTSRVGAAVEGAFDSTVGTLFDNME